MIKEIFDAAGNAINDAIDAARTVEETQAHAYAGSSKGEPGMYQGIGNANLAPTSTVQGPYIARLFARNRVNGLWTSFADPINNADIIDGDAQTVNTSNPTTTAPIATVGQGFNISPGNKILSLQFAAKYEWIYCGVAPYPFIVFNPQKRSPQGGTVDWQQLPPQEQYATLQQFFRLYRDGAPVTCWLPCDATIEGSRPYAGARVVFDPNKPDAQTPSNYQRQTVKSNSNLGGVIVCTFDQVEFWNDSDQFICIIPVCGRGGASIIR